MTVSTAAFHRPASRPLSQKWPVAVRFQIVAYLTVCFIAISTLPNSIWNADVRGFIYVIGTIGIWRYLWWGKDRKSVV